MQGLGEGGLANGLRQPGEEGASRMGSRGQTERESGWSPGKRSREEESVDQLLVAALSVPSLATLLSCFLTSFHHL